MSVPDYYDISVRWKKIAEQGYRSVYRKGKMVNQKLSPREVIEAKRHAEHYMRIAEEFGQVKE